MSVLLVEVLSNTIPCALPPTFAFDKELLVIAESTVLPPTLKTVYSQVQTCEEFTSGRKGNRCFLRTSSELCRGVVAGTLGTIFNLSICSERPDLYERMIKPLQIYAAIGSLQDSNAQIGPTDPWSSAGPDRQTATSSAARPTTPQSTGASKPQQEMSLEVFQKCCNIYLSIVGSVRLRTFTVHEVRSQILDVLNGKHVKSVPSVINKEKAALLIFNAFIQAGFYRVDGNSIIYDPQKCSLTRFPATSEMLSLSNSARVINIKIQADDPLYFNVCNNFLNKYLTNPRVRSGRTEDVVREIEKIICTYGVPQLAKDLAQVVFSSFCTSDYIALVNGAVSYNTFLCKPKRFNTHTLPAPVFISMLENPDLTTQSNPKPTLETETKDLDTGIAYHITNIIEKVMAKNPPTSPVQSMNLIQKCFLEYEREAGLTFNAKDVVEVIQTLIEFFKGVGFEFPI